MGFETNQSANKTYVRIASKKANDNTTVLYKYFEASERQEDGTYSRTEMVSNGKPVGFYGFLTKIEPKLDNKIVTKDGRTINNPKLSFEFVDDSNQNYVIDIPFTNDKGRVTNYLFGLLNSMASIEKFGYLNLYITKQIDKTDSTVIRYNIAIKNVVNWVSGSKNFSAFSTKDAMVNWKYNLKTDVPPYEIKKEVDGEILTKDNTKAHQAFFLKIIDDINKVLTTQVYDIGENTSASMNISTKLVEEEEEVVFETTPEEKESKTKPKSLKKTETVKEPVFSSDDDDDDELPF